MDRVRKYLLLIILIISGLSCKHYNEKVAKLYRNYQETSEIKNILINDTTTGNLEVLAKVWGLVKYYHPVFEDSIYNIDYELFELIPKIVKSTPKERDEILSIWIDSFGPFASDKEEYDRIISNPNVKLKPSTEWIDDTTTLGKALSEKLIQVKYAKRKGENHYVQFFKYTGNPNFKNENSYSQLFNVDCGYRLLSLFSYWNMIEYYYPSKYLTDNEWRTILRKYIPLFINAKDRVEYNLICYRLISEINDTHASAFYIFDNISGRKIAPLFLRYVENKVIIDAPNYYMSPKNKKNDSRKDFVSSLLPDTPLLSGFFAGDEIIKINNKSVDSLLNVVRKYTSYSNEDVFMRDALINILRTKNDSISVTFLRQSIKMDTVLETIDIKKYLSIYHEKFNKKALQCYKSLNDSIGYFYPGQYKSGNALEIYEKIKNKKGIVIDLRCYPDPRERMIKGFIEKFLIPRDTTFCVATTTDFKIPGLFCSIPVKIKGTKNYYTGKIVVIVNEDTQSAAEYHAMAFQSSPNTIVIGSTTAGADGDISILSLPGGVYSIFSGIGIYYPDGKQTQRKGIRIDEVVKPTIKGIKEGRDELLERAISIISDYKH